MVEDARTNGAMVAFEDELQFEGRHLGSAVEELSALVRANPNVAASFLRHLDRIVCGRLDHWGHARFHAYKGIPLYKAELDGWVMIYAVEDQRLGDRKVSVLFCGPIGTPARVGELTWDGDDIDALREGIVAARAAAWFVKELHR